jgi:hypothetical protein
VHMGLDGSFLNDDVVQRDLTWFFSFKLHNDEWCCGDLLKCYEIFLTNFALSWFCRFLELSAILESSKPLE